MSEKQEATKKKKPAAESPVHVIRAGSVAASIWRRQSPSGFSYLDFSLTREYRSLSSGSTGCSKNFFARNQQELLQVIEQAARWISNHEASGDQLAA